MAKKMGGPLDKFPSARIRPGLLGRNFYLENDAEIYTVLGLRGRSQQVLLQVASSERMLTLSEDEFVRRATRIED